MIKSFKCQETEKIFRGEFSKKIPQSIQGRAKIKLDMLYMATEVKDLISPPANKFEKLSGNLVGYCSIRINEQYRIVFKFENNNIYDVYITDYH